jgi:hypothetical protein
MTATRAYVDFPLVDTTVGQRLVVGLTVVDQDALRRRVQSPLEPYPATPPAYATALALAGSPLTRGPDLLLVFNDLLLNQDARGHTQTDASARYVGFNIPSRNRATDERGMLHFRIFTGNPKSVPGRYRDSAPARVAREYRVAGEGTSTTIRVRTLVGVPR